MAVGRRDRNDVDLPGSSISPCGSQSACQTIQSGLTDYLARRQHARSALPRKRVRSLAHSVKHPMSAVSRGASAELARQLPHHVRNASDRFLCFASIQHIDATGESPAGISPPGAPRTVRDPLGSHWSSDDVDALILVLQHKPVPKDMPRPPCLRRVSGKNGDQFTCSSAEHRKRSKLSACELCRPCLRSHDQPTFRNNVGLSPTH